MTARATPAARPAVVLVFAAVCIPALLAQQAPPLAPPTFRATANAVRLDAEVQRRGRPVTDLTVDEFEILDNGVAQTIGDFSFERLPIDVSIALDVSRSVTGETLGRLERAVNELRTRLRPGDRLELVTFNMRIRRLTAFDDAAADVRAAFGSIAAAGSTSLIDTLMVMLTEPASPVRRHLIIAFSDAEDTSSVTERDVALDIARRSTPTITLVRPARAGARSAVPGGGIAASSNPSLTAPLRGPAAIAAFGPAPLYVQLTEETGGRILQPERAEDLTSAFGRILDEFRSTYALSYVPSGVTMAGLHRLEVKVKRQGSFQIRARRSYIAD